MSKRVVATGETPRPAQNPLRDGLDGILRGYRDAKENQPFVENNAVRLLLREAAERLGRSAPVLATGHHVIESAGQGRWADVPWIGLRDERQSGISVTLLFCADMSGVYLTVVQDVDTEKKKGGRKLALVRLRGRADGLRPSFADLEAHGFRLDDGIRLQATTPTGKSYEPATIAHKLYPAGALPDDAALLADLAAAIEAYDRVFGGPASVAALGALTQAIAARGFVFEPWQVAAYVTALRTKPFVILAGVSGTGKSRLPALVAELTGGIHALLPVRPDWTDSSDVLGYTDLGGRFRPGPLLDLAREAAARPGVPHVAIVDEMNLARVEQYFAEVLSRIEDREARGPLLTQRPAGGDASWGDVGLPENLALVGTVNMDETTHGFSRKVLDRAFSLEISDIDLTRWSPASTAAPPALAPWPAEAFRPRASRLGTLTLAPGEERIVHEAIAALTQVNEHLIGAQLQVGYRVRDEVALFLLHAEEVRSAFVTRAGVAVDPLDLALVMKILPRIAGGSASIRAVVAALLGWSSADRRPFTSEDDAEPALTQWQKAGRPAAVAGARFPRMAARLSLMHERLLAEGYTSFWA